MELKSMVRFEYRKTEPIASVFHSHPNYEIFYFHEGRGNYLIGGAIYSLSPGDLILMHGMTLHCANMDGKYQYIRTVIGFDPDYVRSIAGQLFTVDVTEPFDRLKNCRIRLEGEEKANFEALLDGVNEHFIRTDELAGDRFRLAFLRLLLEAYGFGSRSESRKLDVSTDKERAVQKIISYLEDHYMDDVRLSDLADHLHMNKHYLSRTFHEVTGATIFTYLYQRRINQAKIKFLLESELSVTEVGYQIGFKNLSHFSRVFKQQVGQTPEQYRRAAKSQSRTNEIS